MPDSAENNLWRKSASHYVSPHRLAGVKQVDVVIVGAGYTGCAAALQLARDGATVAMLEANTIAHGGSGRNVGLVNAGLWVPPDDVERELGHAAGARLNKALASGPDHVFSLIDKLDIPCEAHHNGTLHCAHSPAGLSNLRLRLAQQIARDAPVSLLSAAQTRALTGSGSFHGSLLDRRAGTVQPLAYGRGLAAAAITAGAQIYEHSSAEQVTYRKSRWHIQSQAGVISARCLIDASNAYGSVPMPAHASGVQTARFTPVYYFQAATAPMPRELRAQILPGLHGCWDTAMVMSSFRLDDSGRLIIGGVGRLEGPGESIHRAWVKRKIKQLFPALADVAVEFCWHGRIAMTADHLPKVESLGPNAIRIFGYSGRGIAPATVFGTAAAKFALDGQVDAFPVDVRPVAKDWLAPVKAPYYEFGASVAHLLGAR